MNNFIKLSDIYVTAINFDGSWKPTPLLECPVYKTLDNMDWSIHDQYVFWLNEYNKHQWITTTSSYKELFLSIKNNGFDINKGSILFKNVYEYIHMYELCKLPKCTTWHWVIKDGQHRLAILLYLNKNMILEIDNDHVLRGFIG